MPFFRSELSQRVSDCRIESAVVQLETLRILTKIETFGIRLSIHDLAREGETQVVSPVYPIPHQTYWGLGLSRLLQAFAPAQR